MTLVTPLPKQGKKKKRSKTTDFKECDRLAALITKSIGMCESGRLDHKGNLQWAHGFGRGYPATRWDPRNSWCLCAGCHMYYTHRPIEWEDWMVARLSEPVYRELRDLARDGVRVDLKALRVELEELWKQIQT